MRAWIDLVENITPPKNGKFWLNLKSGEIYPVTNDHHAIEALTIPDLRSALMQAFGDEFGDLEKIARETYQEFTGEPDAKYLDHHDRICRALYEAGFARGDQRPLPSGTMSLSLSFVSRFERQVRKFVQLSGAREFYFDLDDLHDGSCLSRERLDQWLEGTTFKALIRAENR